MQRATNKQAFHQKLKVRGLWLMTVHGIELGCSSHVSQRVAK